MLFLLAFTGGLEGWEGRFEKCLCTYKNLPDLHRSICLKRLKEWGGHPGAPFVFPDEDKWGRMEHRAGSTPRALVPHLQSCPRGSGGDRRECGTMRTCVGGGGVPCSCHPTRPHHSHHHRSSPGTRHITPNPEHPTSSVPGPERRGKHTQQQENPGLVPSWASTQDGKCHREDI